MMFLLLPISTLWFLYRICYHRYGEWRLAALSTIVVWSTLIVIVTESLSICNSIKFEYILAIRLLISIALGIIHLIVLHKPATGLKALRKCLKSPKLPSPPSPLSQGERGKFKVPLKRGRGI
jgi:hypothetical protein